MTTLMRTLTKTAGAATAADAAATVSGTAYSWLCQPACRLPKINTRRHHNNDTWAKVEVAGSRVSGLMALDNARLLVCHLTPRAAPFCSLMSSFR